MRNLITKLMKTRQLSLLVGSITSLLTCLSAPAANQTWTGGSTLDGNWATLLNWAGGGGPPADKAAAFPAGH
jgi:hypothetical protein